MISIILDHEKHIRPNVLIFKDAFIDRFDLESTINKDFKDLLFEKEEQTSSMLGETTASKLNVDSSRSRIQHETREHE